MEHGVYSDSELDMDSGDSDSGDNDLDDNDSEDDIDASIHAKALIKQTTETFLSLQHLLNISLPIDTPGLQQILDSITLLENCFSKAMVDRVYASEEKVKEIADRYESVWLDKNEDSILQRQAEVPAAPAAVHQQANATIAAVPTNQQPNTIQATVPPTQQAPASPTAPPTATTIEQMNATFALRILEAATELASSGPDDSLFVGCSGIGLPLIIQIQDAFRDPNKSLKSIVTILEQFFIAIDTSICVANTKKNLAVLKASNQTNAAAALTSIPTDITMVNGADMQKKLHENSNSTVVSTTPDEVKKAILAAKLLQKEADKAIKREVTAGHDTVLIARSKEIKKNRKRLFL